MLLAHRYPAGAVYIGREMLQYGLRRSKWANDLKIGRDGTREEVIAKYERHLYDSGLINDVHELRGCDLVCWCAPPCHPSTDVADLAAAGLQGLTQARRSHDATVRSGLALLRSPRDLIIFLQQARGL